MSVEYDLLVERCCEAKRAGHSHVCVWCGAGVDEDGEGEHFADCSRPVSGEGRSPDKSVRDDLPDRLLVDAAGFVWRSWDDEDYISGCPFNPDNEPLPEPVTTYVRFAESEARLKERLRLIEGEARNAIRGGFLHQHEWVKVLNLAEQRGSLLASGLDTVQRTEEGTRMSDQQPTPHGDIVRLPPISDKRLAELRELVKVGPGGRMMGAWDDDPRAKVLMGALADALAAYDAVRERTEPS